MGIKVFEFVRRAPGLPIDVFHRRWREEYAAAIAASPAARGRLRRYELNHRLAADYARDRHALEVVDAGFDGVDVRWLDDTAALADFERELEHDPACALELARLRAGLFAPDPLRVVTADPEPIIDKPGRDGAEAKLLCILRRNPALEAPFFHAHWKDHHGGLFQHLPGLNDPMLAYDQNHGIAGDAAFDGVTEQWFADLETFVDSLRAPENVTDVAPDVAYMLDPKGVHFLMAGLPTVVVG